MSQSQDERADQFYAETYDESVLDWPNEIDFYQEMAAHAKQAAGSVLELACGTGRVAIRLARSGVRVVGLDASPYMLDVARRKSAGLDNLRWVQGKMQSFRLDETFALIIVTGHAFQHMVTLEEQVTCLECIKRHLRPDAQLVIHVNHDDLSWLGGLASQKEHPFEADKKFIRAATGCEIQPYSAWSYERSTQTAIVRSRWEELDADGHVMDSWDTAPCRLHCVFPFEMEHLFARMDFKVDAVYGDFSRNAFADNSSNMIWLAHVASPIL